MSRRRPTMWDLIGKSTDMDATVHLEWSTSLPILPRPSFPLDSTRLDQSTNPAQHTQKARQRGNHDARRTPRAKKETTHQGPEVHAACDVRLFRGWELVVLVLALALALNSAPPFDGTLMEGDYGRGHWTRDWSLSITLGLGTSSSSFFFLARRQEEEREPVCLLRTADDPTDGPSQRPRQASELSSCRSLDPPSNGERKARSQKRETSEGTSWDMYPCTIDLAGVTGLTDIYLSPFDLIPPITATDQDGSDVVDRTDCADRAAQCG
jgi:hypothetical protein